VPGVAVLVGECVMKNVSWWFGECGIKYDMRIFWFGVFNLCAIVLLVMASM
jgi:hypothetical protein